MGSSFVAFGLVLLKAAGLITGGVAGLALMTSYKTGWPVGARCVAINLPFFILAQRRLGWMFTLKSAAAMAAIALFSMLMPQWLHLDGANVAFAAVFGGSLIGMGVLSLARHRASVGGVGIIALYLQERRGSPMFCRFPSRCRRRSHDAPPRLSTFKNSPSPPW